MLTIHFLRKDWKFKEHVIKVKGLRTYNNIEFCIDIYKTIIFIHHGESRDTIFNEDSEDTMKRPIGADTDHILHRSDGQILQLLRHEIRHWKLSYLQNEEKKWIISTFIAYNINTWIIDRE